MSADRTRGFCWCGCGQRTKIARLTNNAIGDVAGQPRRFLFGHAVRLMRRDLLEQSDRWRVEDRGYATPCWIWLGTRTTDGYGQVWIGGRRFLTHRRIYEETIGPIPAGLEIDHLCRQPACLNVKHLDVVTTAENQRRGRAAKLTHAAVAEIRASSSSKSDLALKFGVSQSTIRDVRTFRSWRDA